MEYMGNEFYWNRKFEDRGMLVLPPESLLMSDIEKFGFGGCGLEVGCGDGRNLIPLAQKGYTMTGIDFSETALEKLRSRAEDCGAEVSTCRIDLSGQGCFDHLPTFNFIIINHYRLRPDFYENLVMHLEKNGYLWVNGFCALPKDNPDITEKELLKESDFHAVGRLLVDKKYYECRGRHFVRYCFRKP